jgi:hypothetical protein
MWRKHPLARLIFGLIVALLASGTIAGGLVWGADFWRDGLVPPRQLEGYLQITSRPAASTLPGRFNLTTSDGQITEFELRSSLILKLSQQLQNAGSDQAAVVTFSPTLRNIYTLRLGNFSLTQDIYEPNFPLQHWQLIPAFLLFAMLLSGLAALIYSLFALSDLLSASRKICGTLVARIERNDIGSDGFLIQVRPWADLKTGRFAQFELSQEVFLATDGADYVEVTFSRFFHYVLQLRVLQLSDLSFEQKAQLVSYQAEGSGLSYAPNWRMRTFLYSDAFLGLFFFIIALVIGFYYLPEGFLPPRMDPSQWFLLLVITMLSLTMASYLFLRFRRKQQDIKGPKRLTVGPVLSKWRVTGTSNDNRRLIVVADGGLSAGEQGIRKFDLSPALYDRLQVGDIVEIEHTPRLRFICRLEVKGHQELTGSYPV